jgi:twinkle protein
MGTFIEHRSCGDCGSSDALAVYEDGSTFCFSCEKATQSESGKDPEWTEEHRPTSQTDVTFLEGSFQPLTKRGLTVTTCRKFNYHVSKLSGTPVQVANYFDKGGRLTAQHLRFPSKDFRWIGNPRIVQLFGQSIWKSFGKRLIITEGEIDAMSISQVQGNKWPVCSIPSGVNSAAKYIKKQLEYVCSFDEVILAFDDDEPGQNAIEECAKLLPPGKVRVMKYDGYKDANELFLKDSKRLMQCIYDAEKWRPDGILSGTSLWETIMSEPEKGLTTPYEKLNARTQGLKKGELWIWTAGSGIGKSTAVHEIGYDMVMRHGETLGILALEESVKIAAERHIGIHLKCPMQTQRERVTDEELRKAYEETVGNGRYFFYNHFGSTDIENLLAKIRYMVIGLGCSFILLDHISIVVSALDFGIGDNERLMIDRLLTKLRSLVEETGCGIQAIVHLKRKTSNGKGYNEGGRISLTDLRGSASLEQLSDGVIGMERDQQEESLKNYSRLRVLKCRRTGDTGACDVLEYSPFTGRLTGTDYDDIPKGEDDDTEGFGESNGDW